MCVMRVIGICACVCVCVCVCVCPRKKSGPNRRLEADLVANVELNGGGGRSGLNLADDDLRAVKRMAKDSH